MGVVLIMLLLLKVFDVVCVLVVVVGGFFDGCGLVVVFVYGVVGIVMGMCFLMSVELLVLCVMFECYVVVGDLVCICVLDVFDGLL